jgi:hypothetical protein
MFHKEQVVSARDKLSMHWGNVAESFVKNVPHQQCRIKEQYTK